MILDNPRAYPIFLTKNYFNGDAYNYGGTFSTTSMAGIGPRVFDMDPFAYGLSSGSVDGVDEVIISQLWEGYAPAVRLVGMMAILNMNLKEFTVYGSSDGGVTWPVVLAAETVNDQQNYIVDWSGAPKSMNAIKVVGNKTFKIIDSASLGIRAAGGEKQVGTIVLCGVLGQIQRAPDEIARKYYDSMKVVQLADHSEDVSFDKRSPASHEFYGCTIRWTYLSDSDRDLMRAVRRISPSFCLYPEPGERPGDIFYSRFVGDWQDKQTMLYKGQGNSTDVTFKEISS